MGPWGASLREEGPSASNVQEGAELAHRGNVDFILAVGGGSVIDCCKIVSVQAKTDEDVWTMEFAERRMSSTGIPMGAVVTIFGTGAEMNNGAVITNEETKQKNGMLGSFHGFAVLDPAYTLSAPMKQALSGAFDMLMYRRMWEGAPEQFARFATEVWGVDAAGRTVEELAQAGIDALEAFIKEIGLPTTLAEMGIAGEGTDEMLRAVADSTIVIPTAPKVLDADAIYEILQECR